MMRFPMLTAAKWKQRYLRLLQGAWKDDPDQWVLRRLFIGVQTRKDMDISRGIIERMAGEEAGEEELSTGGAEDEKRLEKGLDN